MREQGIGSGPTRDWGWSHKGVGLVPRGGKRLGLVRARDWVWSHEGARDWVWSHEGARDCVWSLFICVYTFK